MSIQSSPLVIGLSLPLFFLYQGCGAACNFFSDSSAGIFHTPLYHVFFFQSPSSHVFFTSLLTQSSHHSIGLPRLLLHFSRNSAALFGSLSSDIISTCPAHCSLLLTSLSVKLFCTPVSPLNSTILRLSALVYLAIFRTQLFSHACSLCCCSSVRAKVSAPYRHAGVMQVLMTYPSVFLRSAGPPSPPRLLSTRSLRPALFDVPLSPSSRLRTLPLLGTRNCPVESVSSPPVRCPAIPSGGLCAALPSSLG